MAHLPRYGIAIGVALGLVGAGGCSSAKKPPRTVYVSLDSLIVRHPAYAGREPGGVRQSVRMPSESDRDMPQLPAPLQIRPGPGRSDTADDRAVNAASSRLEELERRLRVRAEAARMREVRLMYATLKADRREALRDAQARIAEAQKTAQDNARPAMRALDLRIVALAAQRGSPAAGPPEEVEAALKEARAERKALDAKLSSDLAAIRMREMTAVGQHMDVREADLERALAIADAERRREVDMAMRRYREALMAAQRDTSFTAEARLTASPGTPEGAGRAALKADTPEVRATPVARRSLPMRPASHLVNELARADLRSHVLRIARERGWTVVFRRQPGCPDMTGVVVETLTKERFLR